MSQSFKLYRLQQIDRQIDRGRARLRDIEAALDEDTGLRQAQNQLEATEEAFRQTKKKLKEAEQAVQQQRIKIEQTEAALYGGKVRNPKELQDLQNEAAALKRYLGVLEDRQLEAMILSEEAEKENQAASAACKQVQGQTARQNAGLREEQASLFKDIRHQEEEHQAATNGISAEELRLYEQLRQTRRGIAVAKVTDKACNACGSTLNAILLSAAHSPNQITRCTNCGRILYVG